MSGFAEHGIKTLNTNFLVHLGLGAGKRVLTNKKKKKLDRTLSFFDPFMKIGYDFIYNHVFTSHPNNFLFFLYFK